jgi:apolipoprotein N-acyltransferase
MAMLDFALALLSGALLALSFPRFGHPAFAWIALVPLLVALSGWRGRPGVLPGQPPLRAFKLGLLAGLVYFIGTIYWTGSVIRTFGGLAPVALLGMLLLAFTLALFPAVTPLVMARLVRCAGRGALLLLPAAWGATKYAQPELAKRPKVGD